jgi:hypothetical protein
LLDGCVTFPFVNEEVEQLVLDDGMADGAAKGVRPDDVRVAGNAVRQGVQGRIAPK